MSFPLSPSNNQTAVLNGQTYIYSSSNSAWTRVTQYVTATTSLIVTGTTPTNSTVTGALQVVGGVGIGGGVYVGSVSTFTNQVNITANIPSAFGISTGSLVVTGGIYATGASWHSGIYGSNISSGAQIVLNNAGSSFGQIGTFAFSTNTSIQYVPANQQVWYLGLGSLAGGPTVTSLTWSSSGTVAIPGTNAFSVSTSTNTGALTVAGGVGIGGGLFVGGTVTATNFILNGYQVSTSTSGGSGAVSVSVQSTITNASFYPLFVSANNSTPTALPEYTTSTFSINPSTGVVTHSSTVASTSTLTGALTVAGGVGIGGSVYVGNRVGFVGTTNASVVYQFYNTTTNSLDTVFG